MKLLIALSLVVLAGAGARFFLCDGCCGASAQQLAPSGQYVEARSASVFAGACHYNGELVTAGREAVLAWSFDRGRFAGQDLAGVDVVAAVASGDNLKQGAARKSIVYVGAGASEAQRAAAAEYVKSKCGDALGEVIAVESAQVEVTISGDHYVAKVDGTLALEGSGLANRECCKMPYDVWYEPFAALDAKVVGNSSHFEWHEKRLAPSFERMDQNDAFVGSFGAPAMPISCCGAKQSCCPSKAAPKPAEHKPQS